MKAPAFAYAKPASLRDALALLDQHGENAKVLAGGQSLIPSLNMRLSSPELLVDITGLKGLSDIVLAEGHVRIGALVTHAQLEKSDAIRKHLPLLAQAVPHVAHAAIRNRGTMGGSLALGDPAAEYPACVVALQGTIVVSGLKGERRIAADKFFKGLFETDLKAGEILTGVDIPVAENGKSVFLELARRQGDYAIIGLAAHESRFVFLGAREKPVVIERGKSLEETKQHLQSTLNPTPDLYNTSATKLHLAGVLLERAWNTMSRPR